MKQAFAVTCSYTGLSPWVFDPSFFASDQAAHNACIAYANQVGKTCNGAFSCANSNTGDCSWRAGYIQYWVDTSSYHQSRCANGSCPDTNNDGACDPADPCDGDNNGTADACETCPKQTGYKKDILGILSYCGNSITRCDGSSSTSYEWGLGGDGCQPVADAPCHTTSDCKKDLNHDGVEDGQEGGGGYNGNPHADLNGNGIPDIKDCDFDFDKDGKKNCEDPCPVNADTACVDPCADVTDGTCKDSDGDGIPDGVDHCPRTQNTACDDQELHDTDGDGILDGVDTDDDGDGIPDTEDEDSIDTDGDGIPDSQDPDDDNDGIPDEEDQDDDNDSTPDDEEDQTSYTSEVDPYAIDTELSDEMKQRFIDRFQQFLDNMKLTSLFSIPDRIKNNFPSGGNSSLAIDMGQTFGQHEVNFSGWSQGLAVLNAIYYTVCSGIAIRIIILKR